MTKRLKVKGVKVKYKGKPVYPVFIPCDGAPFDFEPFTRDELRKIRGGDINIILSKPPAADHTKTHAIALCYAGGKRLNHISVHKGNPVTVRSFLKYIFTADKLGMYSMSARNGAPTSRAVAVVKLAPGKIDYLIDQLKNKYN